MCCFWEVHSNANKTKFLPHHTVSKYGREGRRVGEENLSLLSPRYSVAVAPAKWRQGKECGGKSFQAHGTTQDNFQVFPVLLSMGNSGKS